MRSYLAILVLAFAATALASQEDYYWREYQGVIPHDAVPVQRPGSEKHYYVGQGYFPGHGLLPGMITPGLVELKAVASGQVLSIRDNIQILSSNSSNIFRWISINYAHLESLANLDFMDLVHGGVESNTPLFIGRYVEQGFMNVGKIYTIEPYQGLTVTNSQGKITVYKNFEVLVLVKVNCDFSEESGNKHQKPGLIERAFSGLFGRSDEKYHERQSNNLSHESSEE